MMRSPSITARAWTSQPKEQGERRPCSGSTWRVQGPERATGPQSLLGQGIPSRDLARPDSGEHKGRQETVTEELQAPGGNEMIQTAPVKTRAQDLQQQVRMARWSGPASLDCVQHSFTLMCSGHKTPEPSMCGGGYGPWR